MDVLTTTPDRAFSIMFNLTLLKVWGEWSSLEDCPDTCKTWASFMDEMFSMCRKTFLHPKYEDGPRTFGNRWTI
jgi:hypothetical protein